MRVNSFVYPLLVLAVTWFISSAGAKPIQVLQNKPGWIPVYIRHGNEPLENINPSLVEAFQERRSIASTVLPLESHDDTFTSEDTIDDNASQNPFVSANKKKRDIPHSNSVFREQ